MSMTRDHRYFFSWFGSKALSNRRKHGVTFEEARDVFLDSLAVISRDHGYDHVEERWVIVGMMKDQVLAVVVHSYEEHGDRSHVRIISARRATKHERLMYETGKYMIREPEMTYDCDDDDDGMRDEYDFTNAVRGKYYHPNAIVSFPIYLDTDVLKYFTDIAEAQGLETRELLNRMLRCQMPATAGGADFSPPPPAGSSCRRC